MARRWIGHMNGERYLGNTADKEVHDLDLEHVNCQINEIIARGHDKQFNAIEDAEAQGYDGCYWCLAGSRR